MEKIVEFTTTASDYALLTHDIGEEIRTPGKRFHSPTGPGVLAIITELADYLKTKNLPFYYAVIQDYKPPEGVVTRYDSMAPMDDETRKIPDEIVPREGDTVFVKSKSGAFLHTPVEVKMH